LEACTEEQRALQYYLHSIFKGTLIKILHFIRYNSTRIKG
jgi:hypothetical protein